MILIIGGGGFLGANTARCLADHGQDVLIVQRHSIEPPDFLLPYWGKQVKQTTGDVLNLPFLHGLVKEYPIDSIIQAAFTTGRILRDREHMKENMYQFVQTPIHGIMNCLELGRLNSLRRITFISSIVAYMGGPSEMGDWQEDVLLPPVTFSPIGNLKKAVEQISFLYSHYCEISFVSLRVGWVYGPWANPMNPVRIMVENALAGNPSDLPMAPENRPFPTVYAKDVGELTSLIHVAETLKHPIYNITDGSFSTLFEISQMVQEHVPDAKITLGLSHPPESGVLPPKVNIDRIKEEFEYTPLGMKEGIGAYIDYYKKGHY